MLTRYARSPLITLWSDVQRYSRMLNVELTVCREMERAGLVPQHTTGRLQHLKYRCEFSKHRDRLAELEAQTQHETVAFLMYLEEQLGPDARFLHFGMTSSDLQDTVLATQLVDAADAIIDAIVIELLPALGVSARKWASVVCIGRTHGMHAEPTTVGVFFAGCFAEIRRAVVRIEAAKKSIAVGKISGAVGTYSNGGITPAIEKAVLESLRLVPETVSTQVVARDRHAEFMSALAILASSIERLAVNLRHLQRSEVGELSEAFVAGQKGSSAMPHKKNPITAENLCGLARLVRGQAQVALENIALWHDRDLSHSSVERVILPDVTSMCDFMVGRAAKLITHLGINTERVNANLQASGGLWASERVMLELIKTGMARKDAHMLVQQCTARFTSASGLHSFLAQLQDDKEIWERLSQPTRTELVRNVISESSVLSHVNEIIDRALSS